MCMRVRPQFYKNEHAGIEHDHRQRKAHLLKAAEPNRHYQIIIRYDDDDRQTDRQMKLRSNTRITVVS